MRASLVRAAGALLNNITRLEHLSRRLVGCNTKEGRGEDGQRDALRVMDEGRWTGEHEDVEWRTNEKIVASQG